MSDAPYQRLSQEDARSGAQSSLKRMGGYESLAHTTPEQSEEPIYTRADHLLDQVQNYFTGKVDQIPLDDVLPKSANPAEAERIPLYAHVQITNAKAVDTSNDTFEMKVRLYLMWEIALAKSKAANAWKEDAKNSRTGYHALSDEEVATFFEETTVPSVSFSNALSKEDADIVGIKVYRRLENKDLDMVMINQAYHITFQQKFDLKYLPFDNHVLELKLELDNASTWDKYHLTICTAIFHKDVKTVSQFDLLAPTINLPTDASIRHRQKNLLIPVARQWQYYFHSIVSVFAMLSFFAQLTFCTDVSEVGDRLALVVTLFLTVVAFKFTLDLPKLNYITTLDSYMLQMMASLFLSGVLSVAGKKVVDLHSHGILPDHLHWLAGEESGYWLDFGLALTNGVISSSIHLAFLIRALWYSHSHNTINYIQGRNFLVYHFARPFFLQ